MRKSVGSRVGNFTLDTSRNFSGVNISNPYSYAGYGVHKLCGRAKSGRYSSYKSKNLAASPKTPNKARTLQGAKSRRNMKNYTLKYKVGAKKSPLKDRNFNFGSLHNPHKVHKRVQSHTHKTMTLTDIVEAQRDQTLG